MDTITTIDALVEKFKACCKDYPQAFALGALKSHYADFIWYVEDLLKAIESRDEIRIRANAGLVRNFLTRLEQDANPVA